MIIVSSIIVTTMFILSLTFVFICPDLSRDAIKSTINLSTNSVIPSLFPCFVLTNLWIYTGHAHRFSKKIGTLCERIFHLPSIIAHVLVIGILGGFPLGAQTLFRLYEKHSISKADAEHALMFCSNASPGFVVGLIGSGLFHNALIGLALWCIHIVAAIAIGIYFRPSSNPPYSKYISIIPTRSFGHSFSNAVIDAGNTVLRICSMIMFFSLVTNYLSFFIPAEIKNSAWYILFLGSLDLTNGILFLSGLPQLTAFILCSVLISWNGLCVHCQVLSSLQSNLSLKKYFYGKICQLFISVILACFVSKYLPLEATCANIDSSSDFYISALLPIAALLFLHAKTSTRKSDVIHI